MLGQKRPEPTNTSATPTPQYDSPVKMPTETSATHIMACLHNINQSLDSAIKKADDLQSKLGK